MPASPSSKVNATSLPNITALREELDYGNPHLTRCSVFYDDVRGFRKKFITSIGLPGPDLHNWKLKEHHTGLDEMVTAYLDRDGNGPLFWPNSSSEANYNQLQYSRDQQRIRRLMKYLFFRLNQQQFRNKRYKNKDKQESVDPSPRGQSIDSHQPRGQSIDDPIDVDAFITRSEDIPVLPSSRPIQSAESASDVNSANTPAHNQLQTVKTENPEDGDLYVFRQTPETEATALVAPKMSHNRHKRKSKPLTPDQAAKRTKPQSRSPKRRNNPLPDISLSPSTMRRSSDRPKKPVIRDDYHPIEVLNELLDRQNSEEVQQAPHNNLEQTGEALIDEHIIKTFATILGTTPSEETTQPRLGSQTRQNELEAFSSTVPPHMDISVRENTPRLPMEEKHSQEELTNGPLDSAQLTSKISMPHSPHGIAVHATGYSEKPHGLSECFEVTRPRASAKPNISFIYRFVLSRSPIYSYRSWNPTRMLEETSLGQMIEELGLTADVRGLIFTVEGPNFRAVEEILRDNETGFGVFVRQIKRAIRALLISGWDTGAPLIFEMDIEPIRGDTTKRDEEFDDDFTI